VSGDCIEQHSEKSASSLQTTIHRETSRTHMVTQSNTSYAVPGVQVTIAVDALLNPAYISHGQHDGTDSVSRVQACAHQLQPARTLSGPRPSQHRSGLPGG